MVAIVEKKKAVKQNLTNHSFTLPFLQKKSPFFKYLFVYFYIYIYFYVC